MKWHSICIDSILPLLLHKCDYTLRQKTHHISAVMFRIEFESNFIQQITKRIDNALSKTSDNFQNLPTCISYI